MLEARRIVSTLLVVLLAFFSLGCSNTLGALLLTDTGVEQAVKLREAQDAKVCLRVDGMLDIDTIFTGSSGNAKVDGVIVTGKNTTFEQCTQYFRGSVP